eukprot:scaffold38181_cov60-Phaeocystis_antarctica.AAC.1
MVSRCTWVSVERPILPSCCCRYLSRGSAANRSALNAALVSRLPSSAGVRGSAAARAGSSFRTAPLCAGMCASFCSWRRFGGLGSRLGGATAAAWPLSSEGSVGAKVGGASALGLGVRSGLGLALGAAADALVSGRPPLGSCLRPLWRGIAVAPRPFIFARLDSGAGVETMLSSIALGVLVPSKELRGGSSSGHLDG